MTTWMLMLAGLLVTPDTVTVDVGTALARGLEVSPAIEAAEQRRSGATRLSEQAGAWPNPIVGVSIENLGQSEAFTGIPGWKGLEGQAVVTAPLPVGKERAGAVRMAEARSMGAVAAADMTDLAVRVDLLGAIGGVLRDQMLAANARSEAETMGQIAEALALQASAGRASSGDAARARLASGMAATRRARREATLAVSTAELARRLGYAPATIVRIDAQVCSVGAGAAGPVEPDDFIAPEIRVAEARAQEASGSVDLARGIRMPDFAPQVGVRRTGGETGLYVGLATALPLFDRGSARIDAALAEERAALAEQRDVEERWSAARAGARGVLDALAEAGRSFDEGWFASLEQAVESSEARYRLGEGTLYELLDSRRARLQALDDYHEWQAEWWRARLELDRLEGRPASATTLCTDPYLEVR
jgi:outer membrane protein TolC